MTSSELPQILWRWWKPPYSPGSCKFRLKGSWNVLNDFLMDSSKELFSKELDNIAHYLWLPKGDNIKESNLTNLSFANLISKVKLLCPYLWTVLRAMAYQIDQELRNVHKNPDKVCLTSCQIVTSTNDCYWIVLIILSMLLYSHSHNQNYLQNLFFIYLKFWGLSVKGFDMLHALTLTMSKKWICNAVEQISKQAMNKVQLAKFL